MDISYNEYGVILTITNNKQVETRFEFKNMEKAIKFVKQYQNNTDDTIRDVELHEIALPKY